MLIAAFTFRPQRVECRADLTNTNSVYFLAWIEKHIRTVTVMVTWKTQLTSQHRLELERSEEKAAKRSAYWHNNFDSHSRSVSIRTIDPPFDENAHWCASDALKHVLYCGFVRVGDTKSHNALLTVTQHLRVYQPHGSICHVESALALKQLLSQFGITHQSAPILIDRLVCE